MLNVYYTTTKCKRMAEDLECKDEDVESKFD